MRSRRISSVALLAVACATAPKRVTSTPPDTTPQPSPPVAEAPAPPPAPKVVLPPPPPPEPERASPYVRPEVSELREEAHDILQAQSLLSWKNWVSGEEVDLESTYKGHEELFSLESIRTIREARKDASGDAQRALQNFELYLIGEVISKDVSKLSDAIATAEAQEAITVGDVKFAYRDLDKAISNEPAVAQRARLAAAEVPVLAKLNPLLEQRQTRIDALMKKVGYGSYAALGEALRSADLDTLTKLADRALTDTEPLYTKSMDKLATDTLAIPLAKLHRSDIPRLFRGVSNEGAFPGGNMMAEAAAIFRGLGFEILNQKGITIDTTPATRKNPRAVCIPVDVPTDVRVSVKPRGGAEDYRALFHEFGHAEHYANTRRPEWEFQQLGNSTVAEAYGFLFEGIVDNPVWLESARNLKGEALTKFVRYSAMQDLYMLRRYAAKVMFEAQWHSGKLKDPPAEAYRKLLSRAYGFQLTADDAQRYLIDSDDFFSSADYLRAWFLAAQIERYLKDGYGARWWESPEAGTFLKSLWVEGNRLTPDEVAQRVGAKGVDSHALLHILTERLNK